MLLSLVVSYYLKKEISVSQATDCVTWFDVQEIGCDSTYNISPVVVIGNISDKGNAKRDNDDTQWRPSFGDFTITVLKNPWDEI